MPGPFTHIYTQRRLADFLGTDVDDGGASDLFVLGHCQAEDGTSGERVPHSVRLAEQVKHG